jgi:hypothetical protein
MISVSWQTAKPEEVSLGQERSEFTMKDYIATWQGPEQQEDTAENDAINLTEKVVSKETLSFYFPPCMARSLYLLLWCKVGASGVQKMGLTSAIISNLLLILLIRVPLFWDRGSQVF